MFDFNIGDTKYRVSFDQSEKTINLNRFDNNEYKFKFIEGIMAGDTSYYPTAKKALSAFIKKANANLERFHGKSESVEQFKSVFEEIVYRINNNLDFEDGKLKLKDWQ